MRRPLAVVLGAWVALLGAVVHRHQVDLLGLTLPWGLVLAVVATVLVAAGAAVLVPVGAAWFGLGWALLLLLQQSSATLGGLVSADALGWSFMLLGLGGVALVVVLAPRLER